MENKLQQLLLSVTDDEEHLTLDVFTGGINEVILIY